MTRLVVFACLVGQFLASHCRAESASDPPPAPREFRAAWVATVANIDWPSKPGLPSSQQKAELVRLLDRAAELHLNAVILQVRPACDALYASKLEPWSEYLAGQMGQPPSPPYDPLKFAVDEAHRRGLQLHVWLNPYRARHADARTPASPDHVSLARPEIVRRYGKYLWLDPGEPEAVRQFLSVVSDLVSRYDIDGVHIDDYFYPYPINDESGKPVPFPDDESYARAQAAGDSLSRDDWRRQNVDRLIERMHAEVKRLKPWVLVGVSPFGIWRPGSPPGIVGFDPYASLYADARKWLVEGWVDYFTPQLYWKVDSRGQSYPKLLAWWCEQNPHGRHVWPGNFTSQVVSQPAGAERTDKEWTADEILAQIKATRAQQGASGNVHFSMKALMGDRDGLAEKLLAGPYSEAALVPASPWLGGRKPAAPKLSAARAARGVKISLEAGEGEAPWQWVVQLKTRSGWTTAIVPGGRSKHDFAVDADDQPVEVVAAAVSRLGLESERVRQSIAEKP
jgi:uncharacterized lipoprotein YddW (UPF0748 family)